LFGFRVKTTLKSRRTLSPSDHYRRHRFQSNTTATAQTADPVAIAYRR
jgi:hypothetical protein